MKKEKAPVEDGLEAALQGVRSGVYFTDYSDVAEASGFKRVVIGVAVARDCGINIHNYQRDHIQIISVSEKQRGNLAAFAGKTCEVIFRNVGMNGSQVILWVRPA